MAVVAFAGSRSVVPSSVAPAVGSVLASGRSVVVGCAAGVDAAVAAAAPGARVVRSSGSSPAALAARTRRVVAAAVSGGPGSGLVAFPAVSCPAACFPGSGLGGGSGTWLAVAFAVRRGLPVAVFLPAGVSAPAWRGGSWVPAPAGGVWSGAVRWVPGAVQLAF